MPLTPKNRKEEWLQGLVDHETTLTSKNRSEEWMKEIIDASGGGGGGGTGGGVLVCNVDDENALDKTWQEIHDAPFAIVQLDTPVGLFKCPVTSVGSSDDKYVVLSATITGSNVGEADVAVDKYIASSANGYPVLQD